jgi:hypothetical protein
MAIRESGSMRALPILIGISHRKLGLGRVCKSVVVGRSFAWDAEI